MQLGRHEGHLHAGAVEAPELSPRAIRERGRHESKVEPSSTGLDFLLPLGVEPDLFTILFISPFIQFIFYFWLYF